MQRNQQGRQTSYELREDHGSFRRWETAHRDCIFLPKKRKKDTCIPSLVQVLPLREDFFIILPAHHTFGLGVQPLGQHGRPLPLALYFCDRCAAVDTCNSRDCLTQAASCTRTPCIQRTRQNEQTQTHLHDITITPDKYPSLAFTVSTLGDEGRRKSASQLSLNIK